MARFLDAIGQGITLAGLCFRVLWLDKELLVFPLLSFLALAGVYGGIFGPSILSGEIPHLLERYGSEQEMMNDPAFWAVLFILYFLTSFVVIFFNAALIFCAMIRLHGGDPTVMDGLRSSWRVLPQIFAWALFASTVKLLIDMIANRSDFLTRLVAGALNVAWGIATFFAIPVLVIEEVGPLKAIRQSAETIRKTWGEALVSNLGIGTLQGIAMVLCMGPAFLLARQPNPGQEQIFLGIGLSAALMMIVILIGATLNGILKAALYIYAVKGELPAESGIDGRVLREAFTQEEKKSWF